MHQSGTSVCIRLDNDKGRNQISGLVCPLPISLVEHPVLTKLTYIRFAHSRPLISRLTRGTCRAREGARLGNQDQRIAVIDLVR